MNIIGTGLNTLPIEGLDHPILGKFGDTTVNQSVSSWLVFCLSTVSSNLFSSDTSRENTVRRLQAGEANLGVAVRLCRPIALLNLPLTQPCTRPVKDSVI